MYKFKFIKFSDRFSQNRTKLTDKRTKYKNKQFIPNNNNVIDRESHISHFCVKKNKSTCVEHRTFIYLHSSLSNDCF